MPQSIIIIMPKSYRPNTVEHFLSLKWDVTRSEESWGSDLHIQQANVEGRPIYLSVTEVDADEAAQNYKEYDNLPMELEEALDGCAFFRFGFNDFELVSKVVKEFLYRIGPDIERTWIDDDYGRLFPGTYFLDCITADSGWDWRRRIIGLR